jgi:hypothetical protein
MRIGSRERLLSRMKAGLERLLARRRRNDPFPENRPLPASNRVLEILGEPNRRPGGPPKSA